MGSKLISLKKRKKKIGCKNNQVKKRKEKDGV